VIAAYNCGSGGVNQAISRGRSKNFWDIQYYLPEETRNHVKKFIATHYFFEGDGSIATMTASEAQNSTFANAANKSGDPYAELVASCATVNIYGKYNSVVIANTLMMDILVFNQLNPNIDNVLATGGIYPLRIPSEKVEMFQAKKIEILKQSVELLLNSATTGAAGK
jgi:membrane-bound lytic murein transglycosylase D